MAWIWGKFIVLFGFLASVAFCAATAFTISPLTNAACHILALQYPSQLFLPNTTQYVKETERMFQAKPFSLPTSNYEFF